MEISVLCFTLGILIIKVSLVSCFYPEYSVEEFCKKGNGSVLYDTTRLSSFGTIKATSTRPYSGHKNCLIVIEPPKGKGIVLSLRKIDMREKVGECLDYIEVFPSEIPYTTTRLCRFRFDLKEKISFYSRGSMRILFHVDPEIFPKFTYEEGFSFTYTVVSEDVRDCIADSTFMCANGRCLSRDLTCDGRNNCGDRSDESPELCALNDTSTFFFFQMTDVLYAVLFSVLVLSFVVSCGVITLRRRRPRVDTDSSSDDEPTTRLTPYQAVHPTGFFICQNPAGPNRKTINFDGGFTNPCYPHGIPNPPPPYSSQ